MTLLDRVRLILASPVAEFARGGGARAARGKGAKSSKKAKGAQSAGGSGGACCKTDGGRFAKGNNYGSLAGKGTSAKVAANSARTAADKATRHANVRVEATRKGATPGAMIAARSRLASSKAARVKAARDKDAAVAAKKEQRNKAARERRAAKKAETKQAAAKPARDRAVGAMVARAKGASEKAGAVKAAKVKAEAAKAKSAPDTASGEFYRAYKAERIARYRAYAASAKARSDAALGTSNRVADRIPMGQPILAGHHSEKRHRRDIARIHSAMDKAVGERKKADYWERRANSAESNKAISSRDPEAPTLIRARVAVLEKQQAHRKEINAAHKKFLKDPASLDKTKFTEAEKSLIRSYKPTFSGDAHPFPPYTISNAGANIRRLKERAADLEKRAAPASKPTSTKADRSASMKRLAAKSRAASTSAASSPKAPITARLAAARAKQKADVQKSMATRKPDTAPPVTHVKREVDRKQVSRPLRGPESRGPETVPHRVGTRARGDVAGGVARAAAKADARREAKEAAAQAQRDAKRKEAAARQQHRDLGSNDPGTARRAFDAKVAASSGTAVADAKRHRELNAERKARNAEARAHVAQAAARERTARADAARAARITRTPDIVGTPAGTKSAPERVKEAQGTARAAMVRRSREAAQGAAMKERATRRDILSDDPAVRRKAAASIAARQGRKGGEVSPRSVADAVRAAKGAPDRRARAIARKAEAEVFKLVQEEAAARAKVKALSRKVAGLDAEDRLEKIGIKLHRAIKRRDRVARKLVRYS